MKTLNRVLDLLEQYITIRVLLLTTWVFVTFLYGVKIAIDNSMSLQGGTFVLAAELKQTYATDNQILENQIASESGLLRIEQKAREAGFISNAPTKTIRFEDVYR